MATLSRGVAKRANTTEENRKVLSELSQKNEYLEPSQQELNRLFTRLNDPNQRDNVKNLKHYEPAWRNKKVPPPIYGPVSGIPCGSWWGIRMDCSRDRVHDPFSASVQCGPVGAASICTSQSDEDVDLGDILSITGQSCDQADTEENRSLVLNFENRVPIRIVRSYNLSNEYSPKTGYRYDGLYLIVAYWIGISEQNTRCCKFALKRLFDQEPPPWENLPGNKPVPVPVLKRYSHNCNLQGLVRPTAVAGVEKDVMTLRNREPKTQKVVESVRKRRRRPNEADTDREPVEATTMLLHSSPGRKIMSTDNKNVHVSAIVTRRVSKKLQNNSLLDKLVPDCAAKKSWNLIRGELQPGNEKLEEEGAQSQSTRLQNTNISIRTDLYDSSHNLKQHVRKCGPQAAHGLGIFKPRVLAVQRRELNFAGMDSGPGSSRTMSCVKMERVKTVDTQTNKRNLNNIISHKKDKTVAPKSPICIANPSSSTDADVMPSPVQKPLVFTADNRHNKEKELLLGWETLKNRCLHRVEHSYASNSVNSIFRDGVCRNSVDRGTNGKTGSGRLDSRCSKDEPDASTSMDSRLQERRDEDKTEFCEPEDTGSFRSPENEPELEKSEEKSPENSSPHRSPPFKGFGRSLWSNSSIMNSLTLEKMLDIITEEKSSPMAKMLISSVIGSTPILDETEAWIESEKEIKSGDQSTSQNPEPTPRSSGFSKTAETPPSMRTRSWGRQASVKTTNSPAIDHQAAQNLDPRKSRELGRLENSTQQGIIEIVYAGDAATVIQASGEDLSRKEDVQSNKNSVPFVRLYTNTMRSKASADGTVISDDQPEGTENVEAVFVRAETPERRAWPPRSEDAVDFCCDKSMQDAVEDWESSKPRLTMRVKKDAADRTRLWKRERQESLSSSVSQTASGIPKARIITRSKCIQNSENRDDNSRLDVADPSNREVRKPDGAEPVGKEKPANKMRLEVANLFIDMNMSPSSQISRSRSRRSLRGANHTRRRTCPTVVDRAPKRRNDAPVKHPTSPLKRLKKSVVQIQSSSGKILSAVISKKGLSLRKSKNGANHLNNNNNNNTNNNNNSVKRMGKSEKPTTTMMSKKAVKSTGRQNLVEKKNTAIPKRRDTAVLTRSGGSIAVRRLGLRRALLPAMETYTRKKKKTKEKQKQKPTTVEKGTKRKTNTSQEAQAARKEVVEFALKKAKLDFNCKASGADGEKPKMVSVMTQCSLIPDPPRYSASLVPANQSENTSECLCSSHTSGPDEIKNETIELIELKSEDLDDDVALCEEDEDLEENQVQAVPNSAFNHASCRLGTARTNPGLYIPKIGGSQVADKALKSFSQSLGTLNNRESGDLAPKKGFIRYVAGHQPHQSAFVPVRSVEGSLRIAQLKSIGFKPIKPGVFPPDGSESRERNTSDSPRIAYSSAVAKRGVQEEYNKYTSEENNVVQYMDSQLCYEDIENEDIRFTEDDMFVEKVEYNDLRAEIEEESNSILREEEEDEELEFSTDDVKGWETHLDPNSSNSEDLEQSVVDSDGDVPWHGWRKVVSDKETHYVGW